MNIIKMSELDEEERKKIRDEINDRVSKNQQERESIQKQANRNFEEYTSKHGSYDTNKHTTSIGELRKAYKANKSETGKERYDNLNKSLNRKYYDDENSFGHKFNNMMMAPIARNNGSYSQMMGITNYKGEIDDNKLAERNMQNANTIMKMQTAKREYDEAQNENIRNSLLYKQAKTQNPNATDEELLKITKENGNKFYNDMIDDIASKNALERTERIKDLSRSDSNTLLYDNNKFNNINNQVLQYKVSKEAQEEAEKINNGDSKSIGHILSNMPMKTLEAVGDPLYAIGSALNLKLPTATADQQLQEYKTLKSKNDIITANIDNGFTKTASQISGTIGYMIPSILANLVAPGSGRILQGVSVGGSGYVENLNEDAGNKIKSALTGAGKGYASYAIEGLAGGDFLGKGSLDDIATRTIASKTSNAISRKIASKIYQFGGETVEELLENQVDYLIDAVVNDKGITLKQWLEEQGETAKSTFATTLILDMLGLGGSIENDVKTYSQNQEANYWMNEAQKIIQKENLGLNDKNVQMFNNNKEVQEVLRQLQAQENIDNQMLPVSNNPNSYSSKMNGLANNQETLYNNTNEMESGINERNNGQIIGRNDEETRIYKEQEQQQNREYTWEEYNRWEQSIKPIESNNLTNSERQSIEYANTEYNKKVVLYDENENDNTYKGGASREEKGKITISRQTAEEFGLNKTIDHENVESDILHDETTRDILLDVIEMIKNDEKFDIQKEKFWKNQQGNIPSDYLIAKDILCDRFSEIRQKEKLDYDNVLTNATKSTIDNALTNYYYQVYGKELEIPSSFSNENNATENTKSKQIKNLTEIEEPELNNTAPSGKEVETQNKIAKVLTETVKNQKPKQKLWAIATANLVDKGIVFENLSLKTKNRELQAKYDATLSSGAKGQYAIGNDRYSFDNGKKTLVSKSLSSIIDEVGENTADFYSYMYHQLNIDRMTLEERFGRRYRY